MTTDAWRLTGIAPSWGTDTANRWTLVRHRRTNALYIAPLHAPGVVRCAGPIPEDQALRALRVANATSIEMYDSHDGFDLFFRGYDALAVSDVTRFDAAWLPPSLSRYTREETTVTLANGRLRRTAPRNVTWGEAPPGFGIAELATAAGLASVAVDHVGLLRDEWNLHPEGSAVIALDEDREGAFAVVDVPPLPH